MTRRGQNPYANPASSYQQSSYAPAAPSTYDAAATASRSAYPSFDDRGATPSAKPFKTKGMQLGSKNKKQDSTLAEALGGLNVDDEPLLSHRQEAYEEEQQQQQPAQQYQAQAPVSAAQSKDVNPFGYVEPAG